MKVIFLDVDGVLNSERSFLAGAARGKQYEIDQPYDPYWMKITMCTIDHVACDLINRICRKTDAKIVVSSTHRKHFADNDKKLGAMKEYFNNLGVDGKNIIGWTESLHTIRGIEIKEWLGRHPDVTDYVILDDSSDMLPEQMPFFVLCDGKFGVSSENYFQMMKLLGGSESAILTLA